MFYVRCLGSESLYIVIRCVNKYNSVCRNRSNISFLFVSNQILFGVPQGFMLGPFLFNIFLCDLFFIVNETEFASYTDDNTPFISDKNIDDVIRTLENKSMRLFKWFSNNQIKTNKDKCHLPLSNEERVTIKIGETEIKSSNCEKLLEIKIDEKLTFNEHLNYTIDKASRKINSLSRVAPYTNEGKKRIFLNSLFWSQFTVIVHLHQCSTAVL